MAIKPVEILITAKDQASAVFGSLKSTALAAGAAIATFFAARLFAGAVQGASELEAQLSEVRAVSGATADEMQLLRKAAEDAGATTKFTATESAQALGNLARSGLDARQAIAALPPTLQLAQAGGLGLAEASSIVTKAMAGFGLEAGQAGRIADVLAAGANASNTSVTGLGDALSYAAPTAVAMGLSLESTVAILGKFADGGIDASRGGTALNAILAQFGDPASKFRQELAAAGITTNNFEQALVELAAAGAGGQKAIRSVGLEAAPAFQSLLNQGVPALQALKARLDEATGSAAATAATMENNLQGAARGLGSAWDTVKNALATPVLPVLKDGVVQLADALRAAVSDGTVGRFGDAIAKGFQAALTWARAFAAEVDFGALASRAGEAADRVGQAFDTLATYARNTGNSVQLAWGVMSAGANGVLAVVYTVGEAFAGVASNIQSGVALILDGLSKITFGSVSASFKAAADDMRLSAEATWASSEALAAKGRESFIDMADGAQLARDAWAGLTSDTAETTAQAQTSQGVFSSLAETLKEVGGDATALGQKAQAAALLQTEAARQTRAEVAALKTEYEAALASGNVQLAVEKLQQMQGALSQTAEVAKSTGAAIANAFTNVGIRTKTELATAAQNARSDFEVIKRSGQATAEGVQQAFRRMAEAAIASGDESQLAFVRSQAAVQGFEVTTDSAGRTIVRAMNEAADATRNVGNAANTAAGGFGNLAQSAGQAAEAAKRLAEINKRFSRPGEGSTQQGNEKSYDPGRGSIYSRPGDDPVNGDGQTQSEFQRMQKLRGQSGAVDRSLQFKLRDKLKNGTLTQDDLADLEAVTQSLKGNEQIDRSVDRLSAGAFSLAGAADRREWENTRALFEQAIAQMSTTSRTVQVQINTPGGQRTVNTDQAGADAMIRALQDASLAAGR